MKKVRRLVRTRPPCALHRFGLIGRFLLKAAWEFDPRRRHADSTAQCLVAA